MTNIDNLTNNEITKFLASQSEEEILQKLSAGGGFDMENPFVEDMFTEATSEEPSEDVAHEVVEKVVDEKPKKRKRRTKAQIEADKLKEEQAKQEQKETELENLEEDILDQTEDYIVDLEVLEPTKKVDKPKVADNFFDDDFDTPTVTKEDKKEPEVTIDDLDLDFDFVSAEPTPTKSTEKKKTVQDLLDNELSDIVIDVTAKEVTPPKRDKFEDLRKEEQKFKDAKLQNAVKQQNILKEQTKVTAPKKAAVFGDSMSEAEIEAMLNEQDKASKPTPTPTPAKAKVSNRSGKIPPKPTPIVTETKSDEIITTDERLEIKNKIKQIVKEELREQLLRKIVQEELQKMDIQDLIREEFNNIFK